MRQQKGFTLIELMVVIVIIGILSALAVPKMFGTSAKAKAAEVPTIVSNWETLQSAYIQEKGQALGAGSWDDIGFKDPSSASKWFAFSSPTPDVLSALVKNGFGDCPDNTEFTSTYDVTADSAAHAVSAPACAAYVPNFVPAP